MHRRFVSSVITTPRCEAKKELDEAKGELKGWRKEHQGEDPSETFEYKEVLDARANLREARKLYNDLVNQSQQPQGKFVCRRD